MSSNLQQYWESNEKKLRIISLILKKIVILIKNGELF